LAIFSVILAGLWLGVTWWILGVLMFIFINTIPWGKSAFVSDQFRSCHLVELLLKSRILVARKMLAMECGGNW
jgi:uncharacterized membrane protein YccF (DUF307 family)